MADIENFDDVLKQLLKDDPASGYSVEEIIYGDSVRLNLDLFTRLICHDYDDKINPQLVGSALGVSNAKFVGDKITVFQEFTRDYRPLRNANSILKIVDHEKQIYKVLDSDHEFLQEIIEFQKQFRYKTLGSIDFVAIKKCVETWKLTNPMEMPEAFAFKNENKPCFVKLDFELHGKKVDIDECPHFKDFYDRLKNKTAFVRFVGSIFDPESDRSQCLWLYGDGGSGKSVFLDFLLKILGNSAVYYPPENFDDAFGNSMLEGKRIVYVPEMERVNFIKSSKFKALTGEDNIVINKKFQSKYTTKNALKFIFVSNVRPEIDESSAVQRRLIYCELASFKGDYLTNYGLNYTHEAEKIINFCYNKYMLQQGMPIETEKALYASLLDNQILNFDEIINDHFYFDPDPKKFCDYLTFQKTVKQWMQKNTYQTVDQFVIRNFLNFLEKKYGIKTRRFGHNNVRKIQFLCPISNAYRVTVDGKRSYTFDDNDCRTVSSIREKIIKGLGSAEVTANSFNIVNLAESDIFRENLIKHGADKFMEGVNQDSEN